MSANLPSLEAALRALLFPATPAMPAGLPEERARLYRTLVRGGLHRVVRQTAPLAWARAGPDGLAPLVARWLDEAPPDERLFRRLPFHFGRFAAAVLPPGPLAELLHWELLVEELLESDDAPWPTSPRAPQESDVVEFHPSARLVAYGHPVHRIVDAAAPESAPAPVALLVHRLDDLPRVHELTPAAARLLGALAEGATIAAATPAGLAPSEAIALLLRLAGPGELLRFLPRDR